MWKEMRIERGFLINSIEARSLFSTANLIWIKIDNSTEKFGENSEEIKFGSKNNSMLLIFKMTKKVS